MFVECMFLEIGIGYLIGQIVPGVLIGMGVDFFRANIWKNLSSY